MGKLKSTVGKAKHKEGKVEGLLEKVQTFAKEQQQRLTDFSMQWVKSYNETEQRFKMLAMNVAQEIGKLVYTNQIFAESVDQMDLNVLASAKMIKELFGQLSHLEAILKVSVTEEQLAGIDLDLARAEGLAWFRKTMASAFKEVQEERAAALAAKEKAAEEARAKAEAEASAKVEAARAEEALRSAEKPGISGVAQVDSGRTEYPQGADFFGGAGG